jgi:two-component system, sporulation sensor kinase E
MRQFLKRALQKVEVLKPEQVRNLLGLSAKEIDRLETVMDSLIRGVLVCDTSHKLILANKAARRFLSIVSYEQGRETIWSVIPEELVAEFLAQTLLSAEVAEEREFYVDVNGIQRLLAISVMPVVQDRQITGSVILIEDITERRNREARLRRMESLASLTTLAAGIAHEIKNPLGALSIHVQLLQKAKDAQEKLCSALQSTKSTGEAECEPNKYFHQIDKYIKVLNEEIDRLNRIVVDFLFAVRPMNLEPRRGSINEFIKELADFVSFELKEARIECVLNLDENLSPVYFDAAHMKQALLNLIENAVAAMSGGGVLTITTEDAEGEIRITVADTGKGISEEDFPKIFEPYFTTKETGTGLGLTVVFEVIKEHRGEVNVVSREGEGTVFTITLPKPQSERRLITYKGDK